jgi:hypothetical protein
MSAAALWRCLATSITFFIMLNRGKLLVMESARSALMFTLVGSREPVFLAGSNVTVLPVYRVGYHVRYSAKHASPASPVSHQLLCLGADDLLRARLPHR